MGKKVNFADYSLVFEYNQGNNPMKPKKGRYKDTKIQHSFIKPGKKYEIELIPDNKEKIEAVLAEGQLKYSVNPKLPDDLTVQDALKEFRAAERAKAASAGDKSAALEAENAELKDRLGNLEEMVAQLLEASKAKAEDDSEKADKSKAKK